MDSVTHRPPRRGRPLKRPATSRRTRPKQKKQQPVPLSNPAEQRKDLLWYKREFDLDERFPIAVRFALRMSYGWIVLTLISLLSFVWLHGLGGFIYMEDSLTRMHFGVFRIAVVCLVLSVCYWELYRRNFSYRIEGFRLVIERGIFFRIFASVPLMPVSDIIIRRSFADILFGLYSVNILIPLDSGDKLGTIPGLTREVSFGLHEYLSDQLNNQVFIADAALKHADAQSSHG